MRSVVWPSPVWLCERVPGQCGGIGVRGCNAEAIDPNSRKPPASPLFRKSGLAGGFFAFGRPSAEAAQTATTVKRRRRDFSNKNSVLTGVPVKLVLHLCKYSDADGIPKAT